MCADSLELSVPLACNHRDSSGKPCFNEAENTEKPNTFNETFMHVKPVSDVANETVGYVDVVQAWLTER